VSNGVGVVWASLLKEPLKVVFGRPCRAPATARGGRDAPHARAAYFPDAVLVAAGYGCGLLRALLAPLVTASDAVLGTASDIIGRRLLVASWGRLCVAACGRLVVGGMMGGNTAWLIECALEEVTLSALPWALRIATGHSKAWDAKSVEGDVTNLVTMAPHWALVDSSLLEPSGGSSQSDASEHTPLAARW
jgi:hypothetical protein